MTVDEKEMQRILAKAARLERAEQRQKEMAAFVQTHQLKCFKCGSGLIDWASTGTTNGHNWAICLICVRKPKGGR